MSRMDHSSRNMVRGRRGLAAGAAVSCNAPCRKVSKASSQCFQLVTGTCQIFVRGWRIAGIIVYSFPGPTPRRGGDTCTRHPISLVLITSYYLEPRHRLHCSLSILLVLIPEWTMKVKKSPSLSLTRPHPNRLLVLPLCPSSLF